MKFYPFAIMLVCLGEPEILKKCVTIIRLSIYLDHGLKKMFLILVFDVTYTLESILLYYIIFLYGEMFDVVDVTENSLLRRNIHL